MAENRAQFNHDRHKWTQLGNAGWMLLHFAADHIFDEPDWYVESVQSALILRGRQAGYAAQKPTRSGAGRWRDTAT